MDNPAAAGSVDSTQQATLTSGEDLGQQQQQQKRDTNIGGSDRGPRNSLYGGGGQQQQQQQQRHRTSSKDYKTTKKLMSSTYNTTTTKQRSSGIISEPYLDDDELKPLIYGYLHKLGRNGHWQKRFFESNGERLTYYKSVKRTKVLATLDLCKVR